MGLDGKEKGEFGRGKGFIVNEARRTGRGGGI